jgi:hypothetical protein
MARHIKRHEPQPCESCGREFTPLPWECPFCGFDNAVCMEYGRHGMKIATQRSAEAAKRRKEARDAR